MNTLILNYTKVLVLTVLFGCFAINLSAADTEIPAITINAEDFLDQATLRAIKSDQNLLSSPEVMGKLADYFKGNLEVNSNLNDNEPQFIKWLGFGVLLVNSYSEAGGNGPTGQRDVNVYEVKLGWFSVQVHIVVREYKVPTGDNNDDNVSDWIRWPRENFDIRWEESTCSVDYNTILNGETNPLIIAPVYENDEYIGDVVSIEYRDLYPDAVAYMVTEIGSIEGEIPAGGGLKKLAEQAFQQALSTSIQALRIVSQTGTQTTLEFDNPENLNFQFNVYDLQGTVVKTVNSVGNNLTVENLPTGVYFIECTTDSALRSKIVVVQ